MGGKVLSINKVTVVGSGLMGRQISMVFVLAGYKTALYDIDHSKLTEAKEELERLMSRRSEKGQLTKEVVKEAFNRLILTTRLEEAMEDSDYVIEAIVEKVEVKRELFKQLDTLASEHTIFATNSSTIVSSELAHVTNRPDKVCNLHFFNPALVMELVEVVKGSHTSEETVKTSLNLVNSIGKIPITISKEISGFVVNRILMAIFNEALYLYENGYASFEEIDIACKKGLNHPIGPFELLDLTGIDLNYHIKQFLYAESGDEKDKPQKSLETLYKNNHLGRKTKQGFYKYD